MRKHTVYPSLTKQAGVLMVGQLVAMPLTFLVPLIMVRYFSLQEFGYYRQLILIVNSIIPVIGLGISQSLLYLIPKEPQSSSYIISQSILIQTLCSFFFVLGFYIYRREIAALFNSDELYLYLPYIAVFMSLWIISENLYNLLVIDRKILSSGIFTFLSQAGRPLVVIPAVLLGFKIYGVLISLIVVGLLRVGWLIWYIFSYGDLFVFRVKKSILLEQINYTFPLWLAMIVRSMFDSSHQYIVAFLAAPEAFAIYSVGFLQLPIIFLMLNSISRVTVVKVAELGKRGELSNIQSIVSSSIRKLFLLMVPFFVFLFINAGDIIVLLYTSEYRESISIFRIFLLNIPLSAFFIDYVPRALGDTRFMLKNNFTGFILSVIFTTLFMMCYGLIGAASGFIVSKVLWKLFLLLHVSRLLKRSVREIVYVRILSKIVLLASFAGAFGYIFKEIFLGSFGISVRLVGSFVFFSITIIILYWTLGVLSYNEKNALTQYPRMIFAK